MGLHWVYVMLTRLHISSFIGLTIVVWLVALWAQGMPVLSLAFVKPFSIVVGVISIVVVFFNKYAWSWPVFRGWYVNRPDIRGTWKVEMKSSWIDPETGRGIEPIVAYAAVRQTLSSLSLRLMTPESRSKITAHSIEQEEDGHFRLAGIYQNEPRIELQGTKSDIHHGAFSLEIHGQPVESLEGHYWTDRKTKGAMRLYDRRSKLYETYEKANQAFAAGGT